jgi:hypothetical protein
MIIVGIDCATRPKKIGIENVTLSKADGTVEVVF